jgi:hypothetical protein
MLELLFCVYMLPTIVGALRRRPSAAWMGVVNFTMGWTGYGWILCLLWACGNDQPQARSSYSRIPHGRSLKHTVAYMLATRRERP